jgi:hypothetical protein
VVKMRPKTGKRLKKCGFRPKVMVKMGQMGVWYWLAASVCRLNDGNNAPCVPY